MNREISATTAVIMWLELTYCIVAPIHLWGWERGLLAASGLTSLLHIAGLLKASALRTAGEKPR